MGKNKRDMRVRTNIAISFISIFLLFSLPEIIFRITDKKWSTENIYKRFLMGGQETMKIPLNMRDSYLFWRAPKDFEFRGIKYNVSKDRDTIRTVCLGDSSTQGYIKEGAYYMKREQTYPNYLQRLLNEHNKESGRYFEVMNAGVGGYSSLQGLRYFKRVLLKYNPDIATFYFGVNDNTPCTIYSDAEQKIFPQRIVSTHNMFMKSRLYQAAVYFRKRRILGQWREDRSIKKTKRRVSIDEYRNNLETLYKITKERGIRLVVVNYPTNPPDLLLKYNSTLEDITAQYNIPFVDLVEVAERYRNKKDKIFIDICHPTPYFNKIIAKEIYKLLVLNKYI